MGETAVWLSFLVAYSFMAAYVVTLVRRDRRLKALRPKD